MFTVCSVVGAVTVVVGEFEGDRARHGGPHDDRLPGHPQGAAAAGQRKEQAEDNGLRSAHPDLLEGVYRSETGFASRARGGRLGKRAFSGRWVVLTKLCILLCAFGAVNWAVLKMFETDAVRYVLGDGRTVGSDALTVLVVLAALQVLFKSFAAKKSK